jgi:hypothetical protein
MLLFYVQDVLIRSFNAPAIDVSRKKKTVPVIETWTYRH